MKSVIELWTGIMLLLFVLQYVDVTRAADPKFDPTTRMRLVLVPADAQVGSVIYRLRASDEEFDYPLTFELVDGASSSTVQIDNLECTKYNSICQANVVLIRRLEPGRYYDFRVSVKDTRGGMTVQSCSITATNYTTPHDLIFPHKAGIIMVPEDAKRGTVLDYVIARKNPLIPKDVILELHGSPLFAIRQKIISPHTTEGTIILLGPLDFEMRSMYHLTLLANDAYAEPGQDTRNIAGLKVVVIVQDVQDVPPIFTTAPPVTRLPASLLPGDKILHVHAEDGDKGNPREIRYGLVSENNPFTSFFSINDTTGEIFLLKPIDEISAITHVGDPVLLTVIAEEVKRSRDEPPAMATTVQLALFLPERVNSPPYFENDHYVARIDENALQGTALIFNDPYVPRVYDDDTGKNGVFSLTLLGNNGTFEISPNVAERRANFLIYVRDNHLLDYEMRHSVQFQILAQELGPATNLSSLVNVTTYINDLNDNPPVFERDMYIAEVPENITAGVRVTQVHATDIDTGLGGKIRYTQILGYLNTSLNLNPDNGLIIVSTDNHGFDREMMPEYHLYVEARDNDGTGNSAQVPIVLKIIDVNDNAPIFEKPIYEFILSSNLRNFTIPAFVKATDADAEEPNNAVRYEIISGNYDNKFRLDKYTGQLMLTAPLMMDRQQTSRNQLSRDADVYTLTVRAYDMGVPIMFTTINIRIYPPESKTRSVTFVLPGQNIDRKKTEEILSTITGGRVIIHDIQPYNSDDQINDSNFGGVGLGSGGSSGGSGGNGGGGGGGGGVGGIPDDKTDMKIIDGANKKDLSVVTATVLYDSNSIVDISQIQKRLLSNDTTANISIRDNSEAENVYKAENRLLFWLLIIFAFLIALAILTLLLCCTCPWCPLYNRSRKNVIRDRSTEDDVHLVHRELDVGKQTNKSVQVAEWMGRREAWSRSDEKSSDSRTKPTHWEFRRRDEHHRENIDSGLMHEASAKRARSADDKRTVKIKNNFKDVRAAKETQFHSSRTNLISEREGYADDTDLDFEQRQKSKHIDDLDSMRRHEIDRGSDAGYEPRSKRDEDPPTINRDQYFIKEGNAEILRLITRGKNDDEMYVNIPPQQSHYIMVENGGKEILMKRFIDEQNNGKHIIREHYQVVPTHQTQKSVEEPPTALQVGGSEIYVNKSQQGSAIYSQTDQQQPEQKIIHTNSALTTAPNLDIPEQQLPLQHAYSNQSLIQQELENSLKQQNALLRQILLEKEKLQEKYSQQEIALETQSLPGHSTAIATQTDCEAGTQTDFGSGKPMRRRARSENDDSMSEDEFEYIRYSPPNSPEGVYWIKRKKHKKKTRYRTSSKPRKRVVMVEEIKRKIRTPIKEESEEFVGQSPSRTYFETKTSILRRSKNKDSPHGHGKDAKQSKSGQTANGHLKKNVLMEISDSFDEYQPEYSSNSVERRKKFKHKENANNIAFYDDSGDDDDVNLESDSEIVIRRNNYSADSLEEYSDTDEVERQRKVHSHRNRVFSRQGSSTEQKEAAGYYDSDERRRRNPSVHGVTLAPASKHRASRKESQPTQSHEHRHRQTISEPPHRPAKVKMSKLPLEHRHARRIVAQSEADLINCMRDDGYEIAKNVSAPRYMEWYYNKTKESDLEKKRLDDYRSEKEKSKVSNKKMVGGIEKRIKLKAAARHPNEPSTSKPDPVPRTTAGISSTGTGAGTLTMGPAQSPPKGARMLREDMKKNKSFAQKAQTDTNHPLLQYSEHRYEHEYTGASEIPAPPTKLPHYMYPETPPLASIESSTRKHKVQDKTKPKPSPIHEHEVKENSSRHSSQSETTTNQSASKQLNASTLEDDHDSGIAMNSLLHSLGKRNPIADKKSVFSIAYDEAKISKIQSESDSPQVS